MNVVQHYDLLVLGGGTAALAAVTTGRRAGARVAMVTEGPVGGDCTFSGCVPSKALIESAARGLSYPDAHAHLRASVERIAAAESATVLRRALRVDVIEARGELVGPHTVQVDDGTRRSLVSSALVVATGSAPVVPGVPGLRESSPLTNENVFELAALPASLAVMGGGAIGCELAQVFARFGCTVTVVEALDRVLAREEPEASAVVQEALEADGVRFRIGAAVERVTGTSGSGVVLHLAGGAQVDAEALLVAVGRRPVTPAGFEAAGLDLDERGAVVTSDALATSVGGVWAAGDVTGRLAFTHAAYAMGRIAAANALRRPGRGRVQRFSTRAVPWVTFTSPEVARVGLSEVEAARAGRAKVAYLRLTELDRAIVAGRTRGFVKLIAGPRPVVGWAAGGQVLGATIVAPRAGEMVAEVALAMQTRAFTGRLAQTVHAYPTWGIAVQQAAAQLVGGYAGRVARAARSR